MFFGSWWSSSESTKVCERVEQNEPDSDDEEKMLVEDEEKKAAFEAMAAVPEGS